MTPLYMRPLLPFLLSFLYSWGTLVVQVPYDKKNEDIKTILTLENNIEITHSILFCIRFKFEKNVQWTYLFSSENDAISLRLNPKMSLSWSENFGIGFVMINGISSIFKIPSKMAPFEWYHFCFNSDIENYHVMVNGILWYKGYHTSKVLNNLTIGSISLGSYQNSSLHADSNGKISEYADFEGKISGINIWSKPLSLEALKRIVESCGKLEPTPTQLEWSNISTQMLNGILKEEPIELVCYNTENNISPTYKINPMKTYSNDAIRICEGLKAELAYPKLIGEFKKWSGK